MGPFLNDLRHALRLLQRQPAFAFAALLCLALGIGANTAVFSLLNGALLRPMPFFEPHRLVFAAHRSDEGSLGWAPVSQSDITGWQEQQAALEGIAGYRNVTVTLQEGEIPERLTGMGVTQGLFQTLGVQAALGRTFRPEENAPGGPRTLAASFYGVEPWNPGMYLALASLLLLTALVAVWLPSRSALKMDPARVLAEE